MPPLFFFFTNFADHWWISNKSLKSIRNQDFLNRLDRFSRFLDTNKQINRYL